MFVWQKKNLVSILTQRKQNLISIYITMVIGAISMSIKQICESRGTDKIPGYQYWISCGFIHFTKEMNKFLVNCVVYNFSTDYGLIVKENIINIHKYLMRNHNNK